MNEIELSKLHYIIEATELKDKVVEFSNGRSTLLKIAQESFVIGSNSHLNSLNPDLREELGLQMAHLTQRDPKLSFEYKEKKNQYLSLGKSFASISCLFDLVDVEFFLIDFVLLQEILMGDANFRNVDVYIYHLDGTKIIFTSANIEERLNRIFDWYYEIKKNPEISPIVIAVLLHYKLVSVHPFLDGNGRISRLVLNLILLKSGFLPVSIPNLKRKDYYESIVESDKGNLMPLVEYFTGLIKENLEQYLEIASELDVVNDNKNILVLTEDGNKGMLSKILEIHGIDIELVELESYDGKDNLASAIFFASKLFAKSPSLKHLLIHRDRDNDNPQQLKQVIQKNLRSYALESKTTILITKFYDIESYFLNSRHINFLFPKITDGRAKELILQATHETSDISKEKLRMAYAEYGKFGNIVDPLVKANEINGLYDSDPVKYRYGKSVLYRLEKLISYEMGLEEKVNLAQNSTHIKINEIDKLKEDKT